MARSGQLTDSSIQSAVWQIELGKGKIVVYWILLVLLALSLGLIYTAVEFRGLEKREAIDQAQLARNIARGEGYTTSVIRPLSIWHLTQRAHWAHNDKRLLARHPDLANAPLYPYLLSWLFKGLAPAAFHPQPDDRIFVPERWVILPFNQGLLLLTLVVAYCWARDLFDQRVAITTGLLLLLSDALWRFSVSGLNTNLAMLLVMLVFYTLYLADRCVTSAGAATDRRAHGWILVSAALLGLAFLTRYKLGVLALPALWYVGRIMRGRRAGRWVGLYLVVFAAVITPWLLRNYAVSRSLLGIAKYQMVETGGPFGGDSLVRSYDPTQDGRFAVAYTLRPIVAKLVTGIHTQLYAGLEDFGPGFLLFFFVVGLLYGFRRPEVSRVRGVCLGAVVVGLVTMAGVGVTREFGIRWLSGDNLVILMLPLIAMYGVAFFYLLLDRIPFRVPLTRGLAIGAFALLNVGPLIFTILPPRRGPYAFPPYMPPVTRTVAGWFTPNEIGCSDLPWSLAWQGDRRTVWLPMNVTEFGDIHDTVASLESPVSFLMLTPYMLDRPLLSELFNGEYQGWSKIVRGKMPANFPLKAVTILPPNGEQYLFADRVRWETPSPKEPLPRPGKTDGVVEEKTAPAR